MTGAVILGNEYATAHLHHHSKLTQGAFARLVKVSDAAMSRYLDPKNPRIPAAAVQEWARIVTGGQISPNDWAEARRDALARPKPQAAADAVPAEAAE